MRLLIPVIGTILSLAATAGSIIWYVMLGKGFSRLLKPVPAEAGETYNPA
ncbi:MAG: hypothetical protein ACLFST_09790 [Spirochaetia bacterium]